MNELQRIIVVGTSCSGKTTLARNIAQKLNLMHIELDALYWGPDWYPRPKEEFRKLVKKAVNRETWVADGNYGIVRDIVWTRADTLIWLNYPFLTVFCRALTRTIRRAITREELFSGNRESFAVSFFSKDSILLWVLKTYSRRKRDYPGFFKDEKYSHIKIIELLNKQQADELLGEKGADQALLRQ